MGHGDQIGGSQELIRCSSIAAPGQAAKAARAARHAADDARKVSAKIAGHAAKAQAKAAKARKESAPPPNVSRPKISPKATTSGTTTAKVTQSASSKFKRTPAAGRTATSAVHPAASPAIDRPDTDFDVEFSDSDLKEIGSPS
jgi:hypothetical protein